MPVINPALGSVFSIRLRKFLIANPALFWWNTYEIRTTVANANLSQAAEQLAAFEAGIHLTTVRFDYATVSTYQADGEPYNPASFLRVDLGGAGTRDAGSSEPEPLQMCMRVAFTPESGRTGFRLYRGCLLEGDVSSSSGAPALVDAPARDVDITAAEVDSGIAEWLGGIDAQVEMVMASNIAVRPVLAIGSPAVTIKKLNNRYFDKAP